MELNVPLLQSRSGLTFDVFEIRILGNARKPAILLIFIRLTIDNQEIMVMIDVQV